MPLLESLKALSDENRLKLLKILLGSDLCVGALANHLGISKPAVSQHLRLLRRAGLVKGEKRGYWTHYVVDRHVLAQVAAALRDLSATDRRHATNCLRINTVPADNVPSKAIDMCQTCCQQPERLTDRPEHCSPAQIRTCHGDSPDHPCQREDCTFR